LLASPSCYPRSFSIRFQERSRLHNAENFPEELRKLRMAWFQSQSFRPPIARSFWWNVEATPKHGQFWKGWGQMGLGKEFVKAILLTHACVGSA
jgi:hypothetical protein